MSGGVDKMSGGSDRRVRQRKFICDRCYVKDLTCFDYPVCRECRKSGEQCRGYIPLVHTANRLSVEGQNSDQAVPQASLAQQQSDTTENDDSAKESGSEQDDIQILSEAKCLPNQADALQSSLPQQQQLDATDNNGLLEEGDSDQDDLQFLREVKSLPLGQILKEWSKSKDILGIQSPANQDMPSLFALDTKMKNEIFSPACIRYMKHYLSTFVDHLKMIGVDTSKINMDSALGIPRVEPGFLTTTNENQLRSGNSDHHLRKRKRDGDAADDGDNDNTGRSPEMRKKQNTTSRTASAREQEQ